MLPEENHGYERSAGARIGFHFAGLSLVRQGCKLPTVRLYDVVEAWKKMIHANIVQLREVFLTKDFDDEQPCN